MTPEQAAQILQLERPWTERSIKRAYRRMSQQTHPDKGGTDEAFSQVYRAREVLDGYLRDLESGRDPEEARARSWDAWSDDWSAYEEEDDQDEDLPMNAWFEVLGVRCIVEGRPVVVEASFRAQLVELESKGHNRFGNVVNSRFLIGVYVDRPVELLGSLIEVVLMERGDEQPSIFVREVVQRSYGKSGKVEAFWFDPLDEPVIHQRQETYFGRDPFFWWRQDNPW